MGLGPGGQFGVDVVAGGIQFLLRGGLAPGGRRGMGVERPGAATPCAGAARARGVVVRWGSVVGSGSGAGLVLVVVMVGPLVVVVLVVVCIVVRIWP